MSRGLGDVYKRQVISLLGVIALVGILVNDGLVLISKFNSNLRAGKSYDESSRSEIKNLDNMKIVTPSGRKVFLKEIANFSIKRGDVAINHLNGEREIKITANLIDPNQSASDAVFGIQQNIIPIIEEK